jgi:hypothetical protein
VNPASKSQPSFFQNATQNFDPSQVSGITFDALDAIEAAQAAQQAGLITANAVLPTAQANQTTNAANASASKSVNPDARVNPLDSPKSSPSSIHTPEVTKAQAKDQPITPTDKATPANSDPTPKPPKASTLLAKPQEIKLELLKQPAPTKVDNFLKLLKGIKLTERLKDPHGKLQETINRVAKAIQRNEPSVYQISQGALSMGNLLKRPLNRDQLKQALKTDKQSASDVLYGALINVLKGELTQVMLHIPTE